ncbi:MAG: GNAT family N-acetyltransferase [Alphaproteobacteria bacterium]
MSSVPALPAALDPPPGTTRLRAGRLNLEPLAGRHVDAVHRLFQNPEVARYLLDGAPVSRDWVAEAVRQSSADFRGGGLGVWAAVGNGRLVGIAGWRVFFADRGAELFYAFDPLTRGHRMVSTTVRALCHYALEARGEARVLASVDPPNRASSRVLERCGFRFQARERRFGAPNDLYGLDRKA